MTDKAIDARPDLGHVRGMLTIYCERSFLSALFHVHTRGGIPFKVRYRYCAVATCPYCCALLRRGTFPVQGGVSPWGRADPLTVSHALFTLTRRPSKWQ